MSENKTQSTKPVDNDPNSWKNRERGCIWEYEGKLSISLKNSNGEEVRLVAFPNKFKSDERHPAWRIYTELPKNSAPQQKKSTYTPKKVAAKAAAPVEEQSDDTAF